MNNEKAFEILYNSFNENINSHAFLLETNNIEECFNDVKTLVKKINCFNEGNDDCNICHTIDMNTNPDFIVVEPIKKEIGIEPVQNIIYNFSTNPLINKYSIYVIKNVELLSTQAANKLLKFLEEPQENIIAFFITNSANLVLPTINSRCDNIIVKYSEDSVLSLLDISEEDYEKYYNIAKDVLIKLNSDKKYNLLFKSSDISKKEREEIIRIFKIIYKIYIIKFENMTNNEYNNLEYANELLELIDNNDLNTICNRIKILDDFLNKFKYNVNKDLFVNKLIIAWE